MTTGAEEEGEDRRLALLNRAKQLIAVQRRINEGLNGSIKKRNLLRHISKEAEAAVKGEASRACDFRSLLRLGDHMSATLFAPQSWRPPPPPATAAAEGWSWNPPTRLVGGFPPAPQPENMQKGRLGIYNVRFSSLHAPSSNIPVESAFVTSEVDNNMTDQRPEPVLSTSPVIRQQPSPEPSPDIRSSLKRPRSPSPTQVPARINIALKTEPEKVAVTHSAKEEIIVSSPRQSNKKSRAISINFGFETDSDDDDDDE